MSVQSRHCCLPNIVFLFFLRRSWRWQCAQLKILHSQSPPQRGWPYNGILANEIYADIGGLGYQIWLINALFPFSPFLHVQSMVTMARAACLLASALLLYSVSNKALFSEGLRYWLAYQSVIISAHYSNRLPIKTVPTHINELDKTKHNFV